MQQGCFEDYIAVLEKQQLLIDSGREEDVLSLVDLEEQLVARIFSVQKSIDPLEEAYLTAGFQDTAGEITMLKAELEALKDCAKDQSARNRELLAERMAKTRAEITNIQNNPISVHSRPFRHEQGASLIDIRG